MSMFDLEEFYLNHKELNPEALICSIRVHLHKEEVSERDSSIGYLIRFTEFQALRQALIEIYYKATFEWLLGNFKAKGSTLAAQSMLYITNFKHCDESVDIAKRVLGDKLFGELQEVLWTEQKELMKSVMSWKGEDWISQEGLIENYKDFYVEEFNDSRYLPKIKQLLNEIECEIEAGT